MSFHFVPPGNPLEYLANRPFRPHWTQHTRDGVVCYFCRAPLPDGLAPCCLAAHEWADVVHEKAARLLMARYGGGA
jgi:hypothetical protein